MMTLLSQAIEIAVKAHDGQTDKAGLPYILHPLRLMLQAADEEENDNDRIVAVLHDVVEDSDVLFSTLTGIFSGTIMSALDAITRREEEAYANYIERVSRNPLATRVKVLDLRDNLDPRRPSTCMLPATTIVKYNRALARLTCLDLFAPHIHATIHPQKTS